MNNITNKEKKIIELIRNNPYLEQEELALQLGISRSSVAGHLARLMKKGVLQRGYILKDNFEEIAIIGGTNVDIKGIANELFRYESSNPGIVIKSAGGVARNVAENLGKLNVPVTLFSAVGNDEDGQWLIKITNQSGVNTQHMIKIHDEKTGNYLTILNEKREQIGSIADMKIMERFNHELLISFLPRLGKTKIVFVDLNLPTDFLEHLLQWLKEKNIKIVIDPVSAKKALKLKGLLNGIELFTPNKEEAEVLSGISINSDDNLLEVANYFLRQNIKQIIITLGEKGVYIANNDRQELLVTPRVKVLDTTGAGDAFVAGVIYGLQNNLDIFEASKYGITLAIITLSREQTVADDLSISLLDKKRRELYK